MRRFGDGGRYILLSERLDFDEASKAYTAFCDELGIATYAENHDAASERLTRAILFMLNTATEKGDVETLLAESGILKYPLEHQEMGLRQAFIGTIEAGNSTIMVTPGTGHRPYLLRDKVA